MSPIGKLLQMLHSDNAMQRELGEAVLSFLNEKYGVNVVDEKINGFHRKEVSNVKSNNR